MVMDPQDMLRQAEKQLLLLGTPMTAAELLALVPAKYLRRIEAPDLPAVTREIARGGQRWNW